MTSAGRGSRGARSLAPDAVGLLLVALATLLGGLFALVGLLLGWSYPGRPRPFVDEAGKPLPRSISEKIFVTINGVQQGMFIKSKDARNPVLLYLHGGMPDYFLSQKYPIGLEDHFTVVWWEQRGSGISYSPDVPRETLTVEQFIDDTLAVANYLRSRFRKEKIYLMGHSGGTFFGIQAVARAPHLYHTYIGVEQMANQLESERRAYAYMLQRFSENGNMEMVRKLGASPVTPNGVPHRYLKIRDKAMHSLGIGTMRNMKSVVRGVFLPSLQCRDYTFAEKVKTWRGKFAAGVSCLWSEMIATDLNVELHEVPIPVYFFHGRYDYTCSYSEARAYFEHLRAPIKGFYTFQHSAHSPMFEEPERFVEIMQTDVLTKANNLADR
jgi:pimeloyl-ACP methyl ester carboxylesterase